LLWINWRLSKIVLGFDVFTGRCWNSFWWYLLCRSLFNRQLLAL
jgi:hypothetical protein